MTVSAPPSARKSTVSTSSVSIVMLRDVAEEAQPPAVGGHVDALARAGAVEQHRVGAFLSFDGVAAVARIPDEGVVAGAQERQVVATVAVDRVVSVAAERGSTPRPPAIVSSPAPPSSVRPIVPAGSAAAEIPSLPPRPLTTSLSVGSGCSIVTVAAGPDTVTRAASPLTSMRVLVPRPVDGDAVDLTVACAGRAAFEVGVHVRDVGAAEVADGHEVGAAEGVEVDPLDADGVHGDVADVAEEPEVVPVRGQVDPLGSARAVEQHRVGSGPAQDGVAAVARIPDEGVVACAQDCQVVTPVAVDRVVSVTAEQQLRSGASGDVVVSVFAVRASSGCCR